MEFEVGDRLAFPGRPIGRLDITAWDRDGRTVSLAEPTATSATIVWSFEELERNQPVLVSRPRISRWA